MTSQFVGFESLATDLLGDLPWSETYSISLIPELNDYSQGPHPLFRR